MHENTRTDFFLAKVQRIVIIFVVFFFCTAFVLTGIKSCAGRGTDSNDSSIELERISGELEGTKKQLENAGNTASDVAAGLRSATAGVRAIEADSKRLEQTLGAAGKQAAAIGSGIGGIGVTDTAIRETVERIERFIDETNEANNLP